MEDLAQKEKLSKLAILDTLLVKKEPLSESEEVYPLQPEVEFGFPKECYCGREPLLATSYTRNDPGRRFYTCDNIDDGDCHVYKWWDVAVTEEIKALGTQYAQLSDKVDYLSFLSDDDTHMREFKDLQFDLEQKLLRAERIGCDLARNTSRLFRIACVMVVVLVLIGIGLAARMFYSCDNIDDGDCHVYKWWDVVVTEEIKALGTQYAQLSDKVDYLSFLSDDDTHMREFKDRKFDLEQKLLRVERIGCDLARNTSRLFRIACVMVVVLVLIGIGLAARM
ncbi:hypothetical protein DY000_02045383 [Brassica cretica]|uniref:GRF-type domain-containing protein n=1 Tax=Brassica cretica TaxID=69181 RepID=A0ABQ7EQ28_BRACR|nr:hypothetical protein DY000_02045383 [Brassica cretica]